jgi:hypothetical protein
MEDQEKRSDAAVEWVMSDVGYKRFLAWEREFTRHPLPGVVPHFAASRLTWIDAELAVTNAK